MTKPAAPTHFTIACAVLLPALLAGAASAGTVMEMVDRNLQDASSKPDTQIFAFQDGKVRMERRDPEGSGQVTLFRDQVLYYIEPAKKRYQKVDKAQLDALGGQLAQARELMEQRLATMPPEQRERMKQALGAIGGGALSEPKAPAVGTRDTGRSESVAGFACKVWEVTVDGRKESEVCVAAPGSIPGGPEMLQSMRQVGDFLKGLTQGLGGAAGQSAQGYWSELQKINGVPILTRQLDGAGKPQTEVRLSSVKSQTLPASTFDVPAGFTERKLPTGGLSLPGG